MTRTLYILTGASRGMGWAMAQQLLAPGRTLLTLQRQPNPELEPLARQHATELHAWAADLSAPHDVAQRLHDWLQAQDGAHHERAVLINNAGVIPPIAPLAQSDASELAAALRVGLEAPMLLTRAFLAATHSWNSPRQVLNISSGLGRRPMASQTAYCAAKAGLDHFTRCLALEEARNPKGAKVCSLAPGVIDTDMQTQLRGTDPERFPDQGSFARLKADGALTSPDEAARRVLAWLDRPDFGHNPVADVREPG